jgi:hypothetical protein
MDKNHIYHGQGFLQQNTTTHIPLGKFYFLSNLDSVDDLEAFLAFVGSFFVKKSNFGRERL